MECKNKNIVCGDNYRFTILTDRLIRLQYSEVGSFEDGLTTTVRNRKFSEVTYSVNELESGITIETDYFKVNYDGKPFSANGLFIDVKYNLSAYSNRWYYGMKIDTLKGTARTLDNCNGSVDLEEGIISRNGFSVLDDSSSLILDEEANLTPRAYKEIDLYFFAYGSDYKAAVKDFYHLTGPTPLLPKYALGNWWSRFWKYSETSYLSLLEEFTNQEIPLAVSVIDMDWHETDIPERFGSGWTGYTWNKELFPNPTRFLTKIHEKGLAVTLNVHPADGIRAFEEMYPKVADRLGLDKENEEVALFDLTSEKFKTAYFEDVHHPIEEQGVDFWWIDWQQGTIGAVEGIDPLWLLNISHFEDIQRKGNRDIILSRYAGPGSHRYPIGFSGDTIISWDSLDFQPYFTATASNIGFSWWSHDIGGHMGGVKDEELTVRWVQYGVFSPINRLHSSDSPFSGKEPWNLNKNHCAIMKEFMQLRHKLIPYIYSYNVKTSKEGAPFVQPMYYDYPHAEEAYEVKNQYMFGTELMVAPITQKNDSITKLGAVKVWFPPGIWFDFFSGAKYKGDVQLTVHRDISEMPIFVKEGAIVPLNPNFMEHLNNQLPKEIEWHIFGGTDSAFELIEESNGYFSKTTMKVIDQEIIIELEDPHNILPTNRKHRVVDKLGILNKRKDPLIVDESRTSETLRNKIFEILDHCEIEYRLKDKLWAFFSKETEQSIMFAQVALIENTELKSALFEQVYTWE